MIRRNLKRIGAFTIGVWCGCAYGGIIGANADTVVSLAKAVM